LQPANIRQYDSNYREKKPPQKCGSRYCLHNYFSIESLNFKNASKQILKHTKGSYQGKTKSKHKYLFYWFRKTEKVIVNIPFVSLVELQLLNKVAYGNRAKCGKEGYYFN
jgi:hypothetical protein